MGDVKRFEELIKDTLYHLKGIHRAYVGTGNGDSHQAKVLLQAVEVIEELVKERKEPNMYPTITLETYPPMFTVDGCENPFYDEELTEFTVPYRWLSELYQEEPSGDFDLDFFLTNEYTWDDTYSIYERAKADEVIVKERIVSR